MAKCTKCLHNPYSAQYAAGQAALHYRQQVTIRQEGLRLTSTDQQHLEEIDGLSVSVEQFLSRPDVQNVVPARRPRLTDYMNLKTARRIAAKQGWLQTVDRTYDEKFGILWAPQQFHSVFEAARVDAWLLGSSVAVAYLDIDDFKAINTTLGEPVVDRQVLPPFMLLLEAHTSSRGYAFRFGGDEYVVLLPNVDAKLANVLLERIREAVDNSVFGSEKITLSIGFVVVEHDSAMTNQEALEHANRAKGLAKSGGKNRCIEAQR